MKDNLEKKARRLVSPFSRRSNNGNKLQAKEFKMPETVNIQSHVDGKRNCGIYSTEAVMSLLLINSKELRRLEVEGKLTPHGSAAMSGYPSEQVDKLLAEMRRP